MTQNEIIEMARQAGARPSSNPDEYDVLKITDCGLEAFAKLVAKKEREACAKIADEYGEGSERNYSEIISDKIRAREEIIVNKIRARGQ